MTVDERKLRNNSDIVWHYTSSDVFSQIVEGKTTLYATHYKFLNDSKECEYGRKRVESLIESVSKKYKTTDSLKQRIETLRSLDINIDDVYTFCLSKEADKLSLWRSYTPHGGYCIGFSKKEMAKVITNESTKNMFVSCPFFTKFPNDTNRSYDILIYSCLYDEEVIHQNIIKSLLKEEDTIKTKCLQIIYALAKHPSFKDESEFRIVLVGKNLRNQIEIIGGKPRVPLMLPVNKPRDLIKGVFVSPHGNVERNKLFAELLAARYKCNWNVYLSDSPFIGE